MNTDPYAVGVTAESLDLDAYLASFDPRLLGTSAGRRALVQNDPLLFALLYLPHHLRGEETNDEITFSDAHLHWVRQARRWIQPITRPAQQRDAYVAPRSTGKSTWWFLVLPLWGACTGRVKFAAAFADSATQAESHLQTFKHELDTNLTLRADYLDLCTAATRPRGTQVGDNRAMLNTKAGFVFAARGIDSGNLGMKVGAQRPDLLILDDIEPGEANYSGMQVGKRLSTITDVVFPLNINARVVIVGTVTMPGSIIHQLVRSVRSEGTEPWMVDEKIDVHHYPAIVTRDDGTERSIWPGRWSLDFLQSIRHTRSFKKNYDNDPMGSDGGYWVEDDFTYGPVEAITRWLISIDPAISTKTTSDYTGIAVLGYSPSSKKILVEHVEQVRITGAALRDHLLRMLVRFPDVQRVLVETNQGGEVWRDVLHHLPVDLDTVHQSIKKEVRAAQVLSDYQRGRVVHARRMTALEEQMVSFPHAPHDDMVDAVGAGITYLLEPPRKRPVAVYNQTYA